MHYGYITATNDTSEMKCFLAVYCSESSFVDPHNFFFFSLLGKLAGRAIYFADVFFFIFKYFSMVDFLT